MFHVRATKIFTLDKMNLTAKEEGSRGAKKFDDETSHWTLVHNIHLDNDNF